MEVKSIKRNHYEYRIWKKKNDAKKLRNRLKSYKKKRSISNAKTKKHINTNSKNFQRINKYWKIPTKFSIIKNPQETISFFNDIIIMIENIRKESKNKRRVYWFNIDMEDINEITGDALMYLLTVIRNTRGREKLPINWIGNFPKSEEIKEFLQVSGYLDYMKTDKRNLKKTNEKIQIRTGKTYVYNDGNVDIRKEVVDFSIQKLNKEKRELQFLFNILTEVITNIEHAYNSKNELLFEPSWYIMVENCADRIKYIFIDNGLGIPTTVKKKIMEELLNFLGIDQEYKYIKTALDGSYKRTQTGKVERSTGLPDVYEKYLNKKISSLIIVSNYAYYCEEDAMDMKEDLKGTLIYWEIEKEMKRI